jgi:hypothetical protein
MKHDFQQFKYLKNKVRKKQRKIITLLMNSSLRARALPRDHAIFL